MSFFEIASFGFEVGEKERAKLSFFDSMHCRGYLRYICKLLLVVVTRRIMQQQLDDDYNERVRIFLMLFNRSDHGLDDKDILTMMPHIIRVEGITLDGLNQGVYAAAKNKYFQCVSHLVKEFGAEFKSNALIELVHNDARYTLDDVMSVVRAAHHNATLGGLDCSDTLGLLVQNPLTLEKELSVVQLLPMIILPPTRVYRCPEMKMTQPFLDYSLYRAASNKLFQCVSHLVGECGAMFDEEALLELLENNVNFTFEDAMKVKDAEAGHGGLNPNARDMDGNTILHNYCARVRQDARVKVDLEVVKQMVEWGVNPSLRNNLANGRETAYVLLVKISETPDRRRQLSPQEKPEMIQIMQYLSSMTNHSAHNDEDEDEDDEHDIIMDVA